MQREEAERATFQYYQSGFHCAEAITKAVLELSGDGSAGIVPRVASGFGGGIGGSQGDVCGALTGGIVVLGWLFGRSEPSADKSEVFALAAEFRDQFAKRVGSTNCKTILDMLGPQENKMRCKQLTAEAAGILADILTRRQVQGRLGPFPNRFADHS